MDKIKEVQGLKELEQVIRHANDNSCECKCESCFNCTAGNMANAVYKAGYRRVDKVKIEMADRISSIVACHSDYHGDDIISAIYALVQGNEVGQVKALDLDKIRKETAKEIYKMLCLKVRNYYPSIDSYCISRKVVLLKDIEEILVKFNVYV